MTSHSAHPTEETAGGLRPESQRAFRMAQLLLVMQVTDRLKHELDLERLAVTDFLAANPFLILDAEDEAATRLTLAGFSRKPLTYAAPGQRFATRRSRLVSDLSLMVALGLLSVEANDGRRIIRCTDSGLAQAERLASTYADAFRLSVESISPYIKRLRDSALRKQLERWLRADPLLYDLIEHVPDRRVHTDDFFELIG